MSEKAFLSAAAPQKMPSQSTIIRLHTQEQICAPKPRVFLSSRDREIDVVVVGRDAILRNEEAKRGHHAIKNREKVLSFWVGGEGKTNNTTRLEEKRVPWVAVNRFFPAPLFHIIFPAKTQSTYRVL